MYRSKSWVALVVALWLLGTAPLQAQWVMAARAARNRIQQMSQKSDKGGYDVAIVLLEADPAKVYDKALKSLQAHPELTITKQDSKTGKIEFRKGDEVAGFQVTVLGEKLTQLVIASSVSDKPDPDATSLVLNAVLRVCKDLEVACTVEAN